MIWEFDKIGNLCEVTSSKRIFYSEYTKAGIPFYRSKEIIEKNRGNTVTEPLYISEDKYKLIKNKFGVPVQGDMLLTSVGTIGIPYVVQAEDCFYFKDGNLTWFRNFSNGLSVSFLYYWISSAMGQGVLYNATIGSSQKALTISTLKNIEIPVPPIEIQEKIADILSAYDDLIENNQKQIKLLEEAAQRLYKEWFIDLHFPGWENVTIIDGVPEGWERRTVADISSVLRRGISPSYNETAEFTVINQKCIRQTIVDLSESRKQEKKFPSELNLLDSDTVICSTGAGTLGRVGQIFGDYPNTTLDSHVTLVRAANQYGKQFVFQTLKHNQTRLMNMGQGSTNQLELNRGVIQKTELLLPPEEMISQFERIAQSIHDSITVLNQQIIISKEARDRLLPKLMSGELEG